MAISEHNNYGTYGVYSNYNGNPLSSATLANGQLHTLSGNVSHADLTPEQTGFHRYRQLSLRNHHAQHQRQISSPATSQYYHHQAGQARPISNYYEYEQAAFLKNDDVGQRKPPPPSMLYQAVGSTKNGETLYGVVGQQQPMAGGIIRKQQPIYQSNQVQIYSSVYNPNVTYSTGAGNQASRSGLHPNYSHSGLPNTFPTKG